MATVMEKDVLTGLVAEGLGLLANADKDPAAAKKRLFLGREYGTLVRQPYQDIHYKTRRDGILAAREGFPTAPAEVDDADGACRRAWSGIIDPAFPGTAEEAPRLVLVGGQPGAGKALLICMALQSAQLSGAIVLQTRLLRLVCECGGTLIPSVFRQATEARRSIVATGTFGDPTEPLAMLELAKKAGYRTDTMFLACPPELSWQGAAERDEKSRAAGLRASVALAKDEHERVLAGIPETAKAVLESGLSGSFRAYLRSEKELMPLYDSFLPRADLMTSLARVYG